MTTLLRIDSSARIEGSLTRELSDLFFDNWLQSRPGDRVIERHVGIDPPPVLGSDWIAAAFAGSDRSEHQQASLALSHALIEEVRAADILVIASPMYNYGMPAALKTWFDHVIRINETFSFDLGRGDLPLAPLLADKTLIILTASGEFGFGPGEFNDGKGHLVPHIRTAAFYLGVQDRIHHVGIEYQEFGDQRHADSIAAAHAEVPRLVERLVNQLPVAA